ncbi:MAG TPA: S9 family peptidase [Gemmatimonadaceae bacterium]
MSRSLLRPLVAVFILAAPLAAQQAAPADPSRLTVERIFSGEFRGQGIGQLRWLDDSTFTALVPAANGKGSDLVKVDAASGRQSLILPAARFVPAGRSEPLEVEDYAWSDDHSRLLIFTNSARVWRANTRGDFWVLSVAGGAPRKLGGPAAKPSTLQFAKFSPDGSRVAYVRENNIYVEPVAGGAITALTRDGSRTTINGTFDWVYEEELSLRDGFRWSPDGRSIAYWQLDATGVRDFLLINNTDSLYSFTVPIQYPKAGTTNSAARIGVVSAAGGATTWMKVPGDPRNNYLARMDWAANSTQLTIQQLNRRQNRNTMWIADARGGAARPLFVEADSAWVDIYDDVEGYGPGPSLHWLPDNSAFVYLSERDGWRHAYIVNRAGDVRLITPGNYDVMRVAYIDMKGGWLYFDASPENATQMYLWRTRLDGTGRPERLTPASEAGTHSYEIGPNARFALHSRSAFGVPPTVDLVRLPGHEVARTLVTNERLRGALAKLAQRPVEWFKVPAANGQLMDGWLMKPADFDSTKKYPVIFYVYGEPASMTTRDAYGGSRWLWHLMLTQRGYIVASVDNRGTPAPKGRAWRKALLNQSGAVRVADQSAAAHYLARRPYVDSTRIGVWGWSGGGSSTLLLMFRAPETFRTGISVAPVADTRNYDTIYQERYLGLPTTDSLAYKDASAIHYVNGLRGDLLVVHGTGDDNVHFQGTEQLINALIAAGKQFQMFAYPNRTHGIYEGTGTTTHLYNLLTNYFDAHLPAGGR